MPDNKIKTVDKLIKKFSDFIDYSHMVIPFKSKGIILNYHRVDDITPDPWALAVSPKHFSEQLAFLTNHYVPVHLLDLTHPKRINRLKKPWFVITFDDGYLDNVHKASPILKEFGVPATFFLTSSFVGSKKCFWWDELTEMMLNPGPLPHFGDEMLSWGLTETDWNAAADFTKEDFKIFGKWNYLSKPPTPRHKLFLKLYDILKTQPNEIRKKSLEALSISPTGKLKQIKKHLPMSINDAKALSADELFEIGAHSINHPDFRSLTDEEEKFQLEQSKRDLEARLGTIIRSFAYPHGSYQPRSLLAVKRAGFSIGCTIKNEIISNSVNRYILPRIPVVNMPGNEFDGFIKKLISENKVRR